MKLEDVLNKLNQGMNHNSSNEPPPPTSTTSEQTETPTEMTNNMSGHQNPPAPDSADPAAGAADMPHENPTLHMLFEANVSLQQLASQNSKISNVLTGATSILPGHVNAVPVPDTGIVGYSHIFPFPISSSYQSTQQLVANPLFPTFWNAPPRPPPPPPPPSSMNAGLSSSSSNHHFHNQSRPTRQANHHVAPRPNMAARRNSIMNNRPGAVRPSPVEFPFRQRTPLLGVRPEAVPPPDTLVIQFGQFQPEQLSSLLPDHAQFWPTTNNNDNRSMGIPCASDASSFNFSQQNQPPKSHFRHQQQPPAPSSSSSSGDTKRPPGQTGQIKLKAQDLFQMAQQRQAVNNMANRHDNHRGRGDARYEAGRSNMESFPKPSRRGEEEENSAVKLMNNLDEKHVKNLLSQFKYHLLCTEKSIEQIIAEYSYRTRCYLYTIITEFFDHLEQRMTDNSGSSDDDITYIDLIDGRVYSYEDFCTYGQRFEQFLERSNFFPPEQVKRFAEIGQRYRAKHPPDILDLREELVALKRKLAAERIDSSVLTKDYLLDYKLVTFQKIDSRALCRKVSDQPNFSKKFQCFASVYSLSDECRSLMMKFVHHLERILKSRLDKFNPVIYTFGSFSNGLATYNSDLDLFIKFRNINSDILDFHTSLLALEVIEQLMKHELNMWVKDQSTIIQSRRCPIIKLNFKNCFPHLASRIPHDLRSITEFSKCDISLVSIYGVYNSRLLYFLTCYDRRFYEMVMVLKYWAKTNELISQHTFSTYAFTMLVIFFLQQQQPPVLPTIDQLQQLAAQQHQDEFKVHKWNFQFCQDLKKIGPSKNKQSTGCLLVKFFKYYARFNFYLNALCPRLGTVVSKKDLFREKKRNHFNLFNMSSYFCIEDPFVLDHNVGYNFRSRHIHEFHGSFMAMAEYPITEQNCLDLLLDPNPVVYENRDPDLFPTCNFFNYELVFDQSHKTYQLRLADQALTEANMDAMWRNVMRFFFHCIQHLLRDYLRMDGYELKLTADERKIVCMTTWPQLEQILATKHWNLLKIFINSAFNVRMGNNLEKLKTFRRKFRKELQDRLVVQKYNEPRADKPFEWFTLSYRLSEYKLAYFEIETKNQNAFSLIDLILSIIQMFLHAIDRANPDDSFNHLYETFFSK